MEGPFDGEEAIALMTNLNAGATGAMSSALLPGLKTSGRTSSCGPARGRGNALRTYLVVD